MAALLRNKYLHREIREKGGAYGGGAKTDSHGALTFYSYRSVIMSNKGELHTKLYLLMVLLLFG